MLKGGGSGRAFDLGVKVEAQFSVGEYDIVVLSAKDALGLETWLKQEKYKIPEGAEALFRPYIQQGMKFFVAKVNAKKVTFEKGMAALSPLRFHYDSEKFELPIRLGPHQREGEAGPDRPHPGEEPALRGGELPERHHPHEHRPGALGEERVPVLLREPVRPHARRRTRRPW